MPFSNDLRKEFKDKITFVYLSIDSNKESWEKASKHEKIDEYLHNYLILDHHKNNLDNSIKHLNISNVLPLCVGFVINFTFVLFSNSKE